MTTWVQWLSDHSLAVTVALAVFALVCEAVYLFFLIAGNRVTRQTSTRQWTFTWITNAALLACTMALSWLLGPWVSPWFSHALSGQSGLSAWLGLGSVASIAHIVLGVLLLDLVAYALHRAMHVVPLFWRMHQVHHSDTAMNASTHFRQHPLQLIATTAMQFPLLWLLGIPGISWVLYAVLATVVELWHHSAIRLSSGLDRWLGLLVVTPNFHRTHHNQERKFHDANYSAVFPIWDRLFGTAASSSLNAPIGLRRWTANEAGATIAINACLLMPFQPLTTSLAADKREARQKIRANHRGKT